MITVVTLTRNERLMAPFFLRHYHFADSIVVHDNSSGDGTPEFLARDPRVKIVRYDTGGKLRDDENMRIKNTAYKSLPGDWFIIIDFDEFVWHADIRGYLDACSHRGITLPIIDGYQMIGDAVPPDDVALTEAIKDGVSDGFYCKRVLVHRDVDINFDPGAHVSRPTGRVVSTNKRDVKLLHYNWLSREHGLARRRRTGAQLSAENLCNGWGTQVLDIAGEAALYDRMKSERKPVI